MLWCDNCGKLVEHNYCGHCGKARVDMVDPSKYPYNYDVYMHEDSDTAYERMYEVVNELNIDPNSEIAKQIANAMYEVKFTFQLKDVGSSPEIIAVNDFRVIKEKIQ